MQRRDVGALIADRDGTSTGHAIAHIQERATLFIGAGVQCYEGMIVGENSRIHDMNFDVTREKKLTNMRASGHDEAVVITPHRQLGLEAAVEWIDDDELVEVTPSTVRLRKRELRSSFRPKGMRTGRTQLPPPVTARPAGLS